MRKNRLKAQQQDFDNKIKAVERAGEYFTSSLDIMFQQNASYSNYKRNIESATRIQNSDDPYEIISEFNSKLDELERLSAQRYNQRINEINTSYAQQSSYNTTAMEQAGTDIGTMIVKMSLPKQIAKEKAAAKEKLESQKRRMLSKIKDKRIKEFKNNKNSYYKRAASEIDMSNEDYYLKMAEYYQCKMDKAESRFSINNTDWVDPDCKEVREKYSKTSDTPTDKELYLASIRKFKNSNKYYKSASKNFVEMAIKENPKVPNYYFHRAKFEEVGTMTHIALLDKTLELDPNNVRAKDYLEFSRAEKKRFDETTYFDSKWKVTNRKQATYYRPLVSLVDNLIHIKDYYSSNNQIQMEGFASNLDENNNATYEGEVIYYFESGKIDSRMYYSSGVLKQVLDKNKNGKIKIGFYNGRNKPIFVTDEFGDITEINYSKNGYISEAKWNYTSGYKKKYNKYLGFNLDGRGDLLYRDEYNVKGKLINRKVEDRIDAMYAASKNYIENKEYKLAIKFLENGIVLYPNDALLYYYLGFAKSRNESLFSSLNKTINKSVNVSLSNKISKNNQDAIDYFIEGLSLVLNDKELELKFYNELGNLYYKVQDFRKSAEVFVKALKIQPQNAPLLNSYSRSLAFSTQQLNEAQKMSELCNHIEPNNSKYQDTYAWVLYKKGNFNEANSWLDKSFENGGKSDPIIWEHKGDVSYKLGDKSKALDYWKTAKSLSKENGGQVSNFLNQKIKKKILLE
jgi:tetratricopeptide (TPR) repeat protein